MDGNRGPNEDPVLNFTADTQPVTYVLCTNLTRTENRTARVTVRQSISFIVIWSDNSDPIRCRGNGTTA